MSKNCWSCEYYKGEGNSDYCKNPENSAQHFGSYKASIDHISGRIKPVSCLKFNSGLSCKGYKKSRFGKLAYLLNSTGLYPIIIIFLVEILLVATAMYLGWTAKGLSL